MMSDRYLFIHRGTEVLRRYQSVAYWLAAGARPHALVYPVRGRGELSRLDLFPSIVWHWQSAQEMAWPWGV